MKFLKIIFVSILIGGAAASLASAQNVDSKNNKTWRATEAYAVLVKEKARATGDLYEAEQAFTATSPQVKTAALRLMLIRREIKKLSSTNIRDAERFSAPYGDLLLTKIQFEVELDELRRMYAPTHIAVKKKQVELASLSGDLKQIGGATP